MHNSETLFARLVAIPFFFSRSPSSKMMMHQLDYIPCMFFWFTLFGTHHQPLSSALCSCTNALYCTLLFVTIIKFSVWFLSLNAVLNYGILVAGTDYKFAIGCWRQSNAFHSSIMPTHTHTHIQKVSIESGFLREHTIFMHRLRLAGTNNSQCICVWCTHKIQYFTVHIQCIWTIPCGNKQVTDWSDA